jgi:hypothetical protein
VRGITGRTIAANHRLARNGPEVLVEPPGRTRAGDDRHARRRACRIEDLAHCDCSRDSGRRERRLADRTGEALLAQGNRVGPGRASGADRRIGPGPIVVEPLPGSDAAAGRRAAGV